MRFSGLSSVPSVMYWKNAMIATSDSSMPYSRMLFFRKPPYVRAARRASAIFGIIFSSMMLMMLLRASRTHAFFGGWRNVVLMPVPVSRSPA